MNWDMKIKLSDLEFALMSQDSLGGDIEAYIDTQTGKVIIDEHGMFGVEDEPIPDDLFENDRYISVPYKQDLDLGSRLVFKFTSKIMPDDYEKVRNIFSKRGAYGRFKSLLENRNMIDSWHQFENEKTMQALVDWCQRNNLDHE